MGFAPGACAQKISPLKSSKAKGLGFDTLGKICRALNCQPGDLLEFSGASTLADK
jgi:putative transcriptional regulator